MNKLALVALVATSLASTYALPAVAQQVPSTRPCSANCGGGNNQAEPAEYCGDQLGHLRRVFPAQVSGVDKHYRVWVTEFCPTADLMRTDGNAAYLRTSIAQNDVLVDVLGGKGYFAQDVYAVKMMGDDTINLYVHRFD